MSEGFRCMSCQKPIPPDTARLFAEVFCCPTCYANAERFMERADRDIKMLRTLLTESVRTALLKGQLQVGSFNVDTMSKKEFLTALVESAEFRHVKQSSS